MADHALTDQLIHIDDLVAIHTLVAVLKYSLVILPAHTTEFLQRIPVLGIQRDDKVALLGLLTDPDNDEVAVFDTFVLHRIPGCMKQVERT